MIFRNLNKMILIKFRFQKTIILKTILNKEEKEKKKTNHYSKLKEEESIEQAKNLKLNKKKI